MKWRAVPRRTLTATTSANFLLAEGTAIASLTCTLEELVRVDRFIRNGAYAIVYAWIRVAWSPLACLATV